MRIGFFTKFSEPVIIRLFFYTVIGKSLFDRNTFRSFLTLGDDGQPVCTANVVGCLIHDSSTSSKKLLVFSGSLEYGIKVLTIQGGGFDSYILNATGKAVVVVPDNVLFEGGAGKYP